MSKNAFWRLLAGLLIGALTIISNEPSIGSGVVLGIGIGMMISSIFD